ncbi:MAG: HAD family hydrolase [Phycisphaerales bacterium]|nr:HAD family hydrolase [Phycisphaerales bacterium]
MSTPRLILDADGVFLDETPYWFAALATALLLNEVDWTVGDWSRLSTAAFTHARLQHVTKLRGCNSNWDLAAVLTRAIEEADADDQLGLLLKTGAYSSAVEMIRRSTEELWKQHGDAGKAEALAGFGIERGSEGEGEAVDLFQTFFHDPEFADMWPFERYRLKHSPEETLKAFTECAAAGYELSVCTGRIRKEIAAPLEQFHLDGFIGDRLVDDETVRRAEQSTGRYPLAKPHWFSALCAATDYPTAVRVVEGGAVPESPPEAIYVGDGLSDFESVRGGIEHGAKLRYIHVQSAAGNAALAERVRAAPFTLAVVPSLMHVPDWVRGALP